MLELIKPCPYCGSDKAIYKDDVSYLCGGPTYNIKCRYCGYIVTAKSLAEAINKWNEAKYE